ncbi:hypothetical protein DNTS_011848 [Danionella cerebrum]|uniref:Sema domain-containing protein n=1 Tax=Danionella cerebrum TaxID=2873325 RepID=A0A553REK2_9TELE|nr:hypothetical protein DNTS_011848 [Danionella translucida]
MSCRVRSVLLVRPTIFFLLEILLRSVVVRNWRLSTAPLWWTLLAPLAPRAAESVEVLCFQVVTVPLLQSVGECAPEQQREHDAPPLDSNSLLSSPRGAAETDCLTRDSKRTHSHSFLRRSGVLSVADARVRPDPAVLLRADMRPPAPASRLPVPAMRLALLALLVSSVASLRIQHAFFSSTHTNNFALDAVTRRVYLASVNHLYQLNGSLAREAETRTGPVLDSPLCHAPQLPQAPCEHARPLMDNHNQLLLLESTRGVLLACGSVHQGSCELRRAEDVSRLAVRFPVDGASVFPSMLSVAANHENASTVGLVFRGPGGSPRLLVAATYTGMGTEFFPRNHSREDLRFENTPEIAIRALDAAQPSRLFSYDLSPSEENVFKIKQELKHRNRLSFVRALALRGYAYLAMNTGARAGLKESQPSSVLARICLEAPRRASSESRKLTESYVQLGLRCGSDRAVFGRLLSVSPAEVTAHGRAPEPYLFGLFGGYGGRTAVCAFRVLELEERVRAGRRNCSRGPSGDVQVLDSVIQGSGAECTGRAGATLQLQPEQLNCGAAHLQHPLALTRPMRAQPVYEAQGLSSISAESRLNQTVLMLGSSRGFLRKVHTHTLTRMLSTQETESLICIICYRPQAHAHIPSCEAKQPDPRVP